MNLRQPLGLKNLAYVLDTSQYGCMAAGAQHTWTEHGWEVQAVQHISWVLGPGQDTPGKRA